MRVFCFLTFVLLLLFSAVNAYNKHTRTAEQDIEIALLQAEIAQLRDLRSQDAVAFAEHIENINNRIDEIDSSITVNVDCYEYHSTQAVITMICNRRDFDPNVAIAVAIAESELNPLSVNKDSGAVGLYQMTPIMIKHHGMTKDQAVDVVISTELFVKQMQIWIDKHGLEMAIRCWAEGEHGAVTLGKGKWYSDRIIKMR